MSDPIVLQLQSDCLDPSVPISTLLRKAKLIASKLHLGDTEEWLDHELNGYPGALNDLPTYRKGVGQPKFFNPHHGWLDIVLTNSEAREMVSLVHLPQGIAELEHLASGDGSFVIFGFLPPINDFLHNTLHIQFQCGLHVSKTVLVGAIEGIKNSILAWAMQLEAKGILGEGLSFTTKEKEKAQSVTNNFFQSNIGVLGNVGKDANVNGQAVSNLTMSPKDALVLVSQIREAASGLPAAIAAELTQPLNILEQGGKSEDLSLIDQALAAMVPILQNASGSLVAASILTAIGAG